MNGNKAKMLRREARKLATKPEDIKVVYKFLKKIYDPKALQKAI